MESKTVLVTGGSGFIGSVLCQLLVDSGHNVINIDRKKSDISGVTLYPFDIDSHQLKGIVKLLRPDTIIHLAAEHEVERSTREPAVYYHNNIANTISLLNCAVDTGVKNFVFSSSSNVYGNASVFPTPESATKNPTNPYGRTKSILEDILRDYHAAYGLNYASLRYFNAAGASADLKYGYTQDPATHVIPVLCKSIVNQEKFYINGNTYDTRDGTAERDYTHVTDIAMAHLAAMNYLSDGKPSGEFNIGSGNPHTLLELIQTAEKTLEVQVDYEYRDVRTGDAGKTHADISKAQSELGWQPSKTLSDIILDAYQWELKNRKKK